MKTFDMHPVQTMGNRISKAQKLAREVLSGEKSAEEAFMLLNGWHEQCAFFWEMFKKAYDPQDVLTASSAFENFKDEIECHSDVKSLMDDRREIMMGKGYLQVLS